MRPQPVQARHRNFEYITRRAQAHAREPFPIPCLPSPCLSEAYAADVYICDVTRGPTRSWKDCVARPAVEDALASGHRRMVVASSGNHGRAIAYACRAAGLETAVLTYERTPADVVNSLSALGATVHRYQGRAAVHDALRTFRSDGWYAGLGIQVNAPVRR